jgi:hypothetical protein
VIIAVCGDAAELKGCPAFRKMQQPALTARCKPPYTSGQETPAISAVVFSFRDCARATEIRRAKYFRCTSRHTRCTMPSPNSRPLSYCATSSKNADRADGASGCAERKTCDI